MYFPKEIWKEIKNYQLGQEYWKRKMNQNFTFKGIYFIRSCELMFTKIENGCLIEFYTNSFMNGLMIKEIIYQIK